MLDHASASGVTLLSPRGFPTPSTSSCARCAPAIPVPVAITMVGRELPDPVGTEFGMVADEMTYGADIDTALRNMMRRSARRICRSS